MRLRTVHHHNALPVLRGGILLQHGAAALQLLPGLRVQPAFVDSSGLHRGRGHAHAGQQVRRLPLQHLSQYRKHSHFDYVRGNYFGLPDDGNNGRLLRTQDLRDNGVAGDHFGHSLGPAGQKPLPGGSGPAARRVRSVNRARNQLQHNFIDRAGRLPRVVDGGGASVRAAKLRARSCSLFT